MQYVFAYCTSLIILWQSPRASLPTYLHFMVYLFKGFTCMNKRVVQKCCLGIFNRLIRTLPSCTYICLIHINYFYTIEYCILNTQCISNNLKDIYMCTYIIHVRIYTEYTFSISSTLIRTIIYSIMYSKPTHCTNHIHAYMYVCLQLTLTTDDLNIISVVLY